MNDLAAGGGGNTLGATGVALLTAVRDPMAVFAADLQPLGHNRAWETCQDALAQSGLTTAAQRQKDLAELIQKALGGGAARPLEWMDPIVADGSYWELTAAEFPAHHQRCVLVHAHRRPPRPLAPPAAVSPVAAAVAALGSAESLPRNSTALLNAILDTAAVGVCVTDEEGRFVLVNRAYGELYGYPIEKLLGQLFTMLVPAARREALLQYYRQFFASQTPQIRSLTAQVERADGALLHVVVNTSLLILPDGRRYQVMSVTDVTLPKAQADELTRRAEQAEKEAAEKSHLLVELDQKLGIIEQQHHQIVELSAPILDVWDRIIALPLIGSFDRTRAAAVTELLLNAVVARRVLYVLLDLTSCEFVDSGHGQLIAQMVQAIQLLGARCVMTGIRPQVAQSLVTLNVDMSRLHTLRSLQEALRTCIPQVEKSAGAR